MWSIRKVPGDGDCLFRCLAIVMLGSASNEAAQQVREAAVACVASRMANDEENLMLHACMSHGVQFTSPAHYRVYMLYGRKYGSDVEVHALGLTYGVCIDIYRAKDVLDYTKMATIRSSQVVCMSNNGMRESTMVVRLLHSGDRGNGCSYGADGHFNLLLECGDAPTSNDSTTFATPVGCAILEE